MKEEIAFELMKQLKKAGYPVTMDDQPPAKINRDFVVEPPKYDTAAITGAKGMTPESVKACTDVIRSAMLKNNAPYTIEKEGDKNRFFPKTAFAAW